MIEPDFDKHFEYENNFYLTAPVNRISKFATHLELFRRVSNIVGEIVECGVFKGASLMRLIKFRALFENPFSKKIVAFDTFGTFPAAKYAPDIKRRAQFVEEAGNKSITKASMVSMLEKLGLYQNVELIEGNILRTVPEYRKKNPHLKISLLHIDVDLYEATNVCLKELYPLVSKGGIVILDDYGAFAGANRAIDDFFTGKNIKINKLPYSNAISFVKVT